MTKFSFNDSVVVLGSLDLTGYPHDSVEVTVTPTMTQGSLLKADGTEALQAEAADVVGAIDDLEFLNKLRSGADTVPVGSKVLVSVAKRGCILNDKVLQYKDGSKIDDAGKAALAPTNKFASVGNDSTIV
jgi:hypothetical protein